MGNVTLFFAVLIGVCLGSFGNVLIDRLPAGATIAGRSRCDGCGRTLAPYELIPLLSWLFLAGRCRTCRTSIPRRVFLVELGSGLLGALAVLRAGDSLPLALLLLVGLWALFILAVIDLRTRMIPDVLTLTAFVAGIAFHWASYGTIPTIAPLVAAGFFLLQWAVSRGRWVGTGDILLAGAIGMLVGTVQGAIWALLIAYAVGANVAIVLLLRKKLSRGDMIPFGPFLVLGAILVLFLGDALPRIF